MKFKMQVPTKIVFGTGQLDTLHKQRIPGKKALIVISNGRSAKSSGSLSRTEEQLKKSGHETVVFDKIQANPLRSTVMEGAAFAREHKCDVVVALGGGSVLDAAKAIAAMATNDGDLWDYVFGGTGKQQRLSQKPLPIVAITTSAGTGSEVDPWGVITNEDTHEKIGFGGSTSLYPVLALVDPELTKTVPAEFTAYQGFDALFHSIECYIARTANFMSDMYALKAIEDIAGYLARAVKDGNDIEAREHVSFANTLSGIVMTLSSCTSEHSMEHAMSAFHQDLPHGAGLIMISESYFRHFIEKKACDERFIRLAQALGDKAASDPSDFLTALLKLQQDCGVSNLQMSAYGIKKEELPEMAKNAMDTMGGLFRADPAELSVEDVVGIYTRAYS